jgi:acyl-CoA thioester hydrolase
MSASQKTLVSVRIYHEDTDSGGVVYHANYLRYMERARTEWLRERGFDHDRVAREAGILFVVRSVEIKFLRPARLSDLLVASAELVKINHGLMVFDQRIVLNDVELARATVRVISVSLADFKSVGIPDHLKQALGVCE